MSSVVPSRYMKYFRKYFWKDLLEIDRGEGYVSKEGVSID
jgi:hypothetical protein|tara:strand:+ start:4141 stop:4260 length:120 start_codon:yes stop_codon:yes gene_type:complete